MAVAKGQSQRPKTLSDLIAVEKRPKAAKLVKLLVNVTIQGRAGALQIVMKPESSVSDLVAVVVAQYVKEGRRPALPTCDPSRYDLHYSQFTLESLERAEKLEALGSRNFFLCKRKSPVNVSGAPCSRSKSAMAGSGIPWISFMGFLL